jgi:hypothetical protein
METQFKTSFIPKRPIETSVDLRSSGNAPRRVGATIFSLIGTIIFLATLGGYGATFVWQFKLKNDISNQISSLQTAKKEFDERFVQEAARLNVRIQEGSRILDNHVSPSSLYSLLEEYTLQTVGFRQFSFIDNQDGTLGIRGSGDAVRYESIVLQSDAFGKSGFLRNVIFTDLRPSEDTQNVGFSFEATLDPRLVLYRNSLPSVTPTN